MKLFFSFILISFAFVQAQMYKTLSLPSILSDNMVLQQNSEVPIWGWTKENSEVIVKTSWLQDSIRVVSNETGKWEVKLKTISADNNNYSLEISSGKKTITVRNILFGEVWLASGQSNMTMPLIGWGEQNVEGAEEAIRNSFNSKIRLFQVKQNASPFPLNDCSGKWVKSNPENVAKFSAVAYFFAQKLNKELNIPIGIIHSSWGGTRIQAWMSEKVLWEFDEFNEDILNLQNEFQKFSSQIVEFEKAMRRWGEFEKYDPSVIYTTYVKKYNKVIEKWNEIHSANDDNYECSGQEKLPKPILPDKFPQFMVSTLYNAMIHPLIPYKIKGVIWYQGESNTYNPKQYLRLFPALIENWRNDWGQRKFPFYFVQIAPFSYVNNKEMRNGSVLLRDAQLQTFKNVSNTGMVVTTDITDITRIHPPKKREVGERLALWALAKNYGKDIVYSGPIYKKKKIEGKVIRLFFNYAENGLICKGDSLTYFEISDDGKNYIKANAKIDGNTIVVWNNGISNPKSVRFGWKHTAQPNLFNKAGLPASPFKTD